MVAAAAVLLARTLLAHQPSDSDSPSTPLRSHVVWTHTMEHYTGNSAKDLEECVKHLHHTLLNVNGTVGKPKRTFVCHKYSQTKWGSVAAMNVMPVLPSSMFERFTVFPVPAHHLAHVPV